MSDAPDCVVCDECCDPETGACKECDCNTPDQEVTFTVLPFHIPAPYDGGGGGQFYCCPSQENPGFALFTKSDEDPSIDIGACIGGNNGCDGKTSKIVKFNVVNKTTKCINLFSLFCISGLSKEDSRNTDCTGTPGSPCPDEDSDCCLLEYAAQFGETCDWTFPTREPNGQAPGPGFCVGPCSSASICVAFRVVSPNTQCGGKTYDDIEGRYGCCCAQATISKFCFTVCCVDSNEDGCLDESTPGAGDGCANAIDPGGVSETCPSCCECCKPDFSFTSYVPIDDGCWSSGACCENILIEAGEFDFMCCSTIGGGCSTAEDDCFPFFFSVLVACGNYNDSYYSSAGLPFCEFIPVDSSHPCYQAPCVCNAGGGGCGGDPGDECLQGVMILEGSDMSGCPDTTTETVPATACDPEDETLPTDPCESC